MNNKAAMFTFLALLIISSDLLAQGQWPVDGPYEPKHVYSAVITSIHDEFNLPVNASPAYWLNVSLLGYDFDVSTKEGLVGINNFANFMPPADSRISTGEDGGLVVDADRRLDQWYEYLLANIAFPIVQMTEQAKEAREQLFEHDADGNLVTDDIFDMPIQTGPYKALRTRWHAFIAAQRALAELTELSPAEKQELQQALANAKEAYDVAKTAPLTSSLTLGGAWAAWQAHTAKDGLTKNGDRFNDLETYRQETTAKLGLVGANVPPLSFFSPPPRAWEKESGWRNVSFDHKTNTERYKKHTERYSGGGGLNLGFVTIGGRGGKSKVKESRVKTASAFGYSYKLKRVVIWRPWFDASLFEDRGWTWDREGAGQFPLIAKAAKSTGAPVLSTDSYKTRKIGLALVPVQLVLAKDVTITATVSKDEWEVAKSSGRAEGAAMLFGIIAVGGSGNWANVEENVDGNNVVLKCTNPGMQVLGMVSRVVPVGPNPLTGDADVTWPNDAWLN